MHKYILYIVVYIYAYKL